MIINWGVPQGYFYSGSLGLSWLGGAIPQDLSDTTFIVQQRTTGFIVQDRTTTFIIEQR